MAKASLGKGKGSLGKGSHSEFEEVLVNSQLGGSGVTVSPGNTEVTDNIGWQLKSRKETWTPSVQAPPRAYVHGCDGAWPC